MKNWKTTTVGVIAAVTAWLNCATAALDGVSATSPDYGTAVTLTILAIGLLAAKDAGK